MTDQTITDNVARFAESLDETNFEQAVLWQTDAINGLTRVVRRAFRRGLFYGYLAGMVTVGLVDMIVLVLP